MRRWLCVLCCLVAGVAHADDTLPFAPADGPWPVGFRVVEQYDTSRSYGDAGATPQGRPIQTLTWYPAKADGTAMVYDDYLQLAHRADHFDDAPASAVAASNTLLREYTLLGASPRQLSQAVQTTVSARREATPAAQRFPVVIYAASDSSAAAENERLCEYLASHGYVVIASPSFGARTRYMTDGRDADNLENTEAQAADIGFLIGYAQTLSNADTAHLGLLSYSWGGVSAVFAAARDSRIHALVELEGSVRYQPALLRQAGYVTPERIAVPMLYFADREDPMAPGKDALPDSLVQRLHQADVYEVTMHTLSHDDFASDNLRLGSMADHRGVTLAQVHEGYGWMARYTLAFLDATLKSDTAARQFLDQSPARNGVPPALLSISSRHAGKPAATPERFATALAAHPGDDSVQIYADFHRRGLTLGEPQLSAWESTLMDDGNVPLALSVAKLHVALFPHDAEAWLRLGMIDELADLPEQAVSHYQHAIQLDARVPLAAQRIKTLRASHASR
ncbi:MAG TPA: dienelactone hydrolase family protein [Dyella sp.]|uniref:dienelactone hydrolase family protein n=1 Tax=Dyella sp. TaxID=1869338 RepID=UPI002D7822D8|nr:dienelactone hydrolase family protein [Dyella sp.]HET6554296.1 dienelactone hydrolase family protein [Dyella sp.]